MRVMGVAMALAILLPVAFSGCAVSAADQEATRRAWAERDAERARECRQARGRFVAGGCVFGGQ